MASLMTQAQAKKFHRIGALAVGRLTLNWKFRTNPHGRLVDVSLIKFLNVVRPERVLNELVIHDICPSSLYIKPLEVV